MSKVELIASIVTGVGVLSFAVVFTILYKIYANAAVAEYESGKGDMDLIEETISINAANAKRYTKALRVIKRVLFYTGLALMVPILALSMYSKITSGVAMLNGRGVIAVASASMSEKNPANPYLIHLDDQFDMYDVIVLEKVESDAQLSLYDVIAYRNDEGVNIIHRIVDIRPSADGLRYVTRGDCNNADDTYQPLVEDVLGKYTGHKVPFVGAFVVFLQSVSGIVTVATVIYCLLMIDRVGNSIYDARENRLAFLQNSIDFETETEQDEHMDYSFSETVYYKNYAYTFDENGLVSKEAMPGRANGEDINNCPPESGAPSDESAGDGDGE